jgi:hypothetical protein
MTKDAAPDTPWGWTPLVEEEEIFGALADKRGTSLFLGRYTLAEVAAVLERRGLAREARKRGLWPLLVDLDSSDFPLQRLRIYAEAKDPARVVVDLKIREIVFDARGKNPAAARLPPFPCLFFEWLTLQNPKAEFSEARGSLPGQQHPGLGMSKRIMDVFVFLGKVSRKAGLLAFPAFFHNAVLFSRYFRFVNPAKEAEVRAIHRAFDRVPIRKMAWIVHLGCLRTGAGAVYEWKADEQIYPLRRDVKAYFESRPYREAVREGMAGRRYLIDWEAFEAKARQD